jgi:hypothetical protein
MKSRILLGWLALALVVAGAGWMKLFVGTGAEMTASAQKFLASLTPAQQAQATVKYDDPARLKWHFIPLAQRKGVQIKEMNSEQRQLALKLMQAGLSQIGYGKATTIMSLEAILRELEKDRKGGNIRDPERYYFTIFNTPQAKGEWGWSVEGHHLSLNFAVRDGQVSAHTPWFMGANPATVMTTIEDSPKKGTRVLAQEEELAFTLFNSLSPEQRKTALLDEKAPTEIRGAGEPQGAKYSPDGVAAKDMSEDQVKTLWSLVEAYLTNMPKEIADARREEIKQAGIEKVYFAWSGASKPGVGHYYRVQGPTFLIEFVNTQPDASGNPANHIHSLWRNLKGDFAIAL